MLVLGKRIVRYCPDVFRWIYVRVSRTCPGNLENRTRPILHIECAESEIVQILQLAMVVV